MCRFISHVTHIHKKKKKWIYPSNESYEKMASRERAETQCEK